MTGTRGSTSTCQRLHLKQDIPWQQWLDTLDVSTFAGCSCANLVECEGPAPVYVM
jgi:hypothetical protein